MEDVEFANIVKKLWTAKIFTSPIITSSRKFEKKGVIRTVLFMQYIRIQYAFWVKSDVLEKKYRNF
jgi:hypothetical protein